ncbi:MAG TPA: GNAT family N-acetyltransferase [Pseudonocardia sp.]
MSRCHVDESPALALAPVAVTPAHQRTGVGSAVTHAALAAARDGGSRSCWCSGTRTTTRGSASCGRPATASARPST